MTEIFTLIATLPGVPKPINQLPGCYERDLPGGWRMAVNGHDEEKSSAVMKRVPAYHAAFVHKEFMWMALVSPFDGTTAGGADVEDSIIEALKAAQS